MRQETILNSYTIPIANRVIKAANKTDPYLHPKWTEESNPLGTVYFFSLKAMENLQLAQDCPSVEITLHAANAARH